MSVCVLTREFRIHFFIYFFPWKCFQNEKNRQRVMYIPLCNIFARASLTPRVCSIKIIWIFCSSHFIVMVEVICVFCGIIILSTLNKLSFSLAFTSKDEPHKLVLRWSSKDLAQLTIFVVNVFHPVWVEHCKSKNEKKAKNMQLALWFSIEIVYTNKNWHTYKCCVALSASTQKNEREKYCYVNII